MYQVVVNSITVGCLLLTAFISFFPPKHVNRLANGWLGLFLLSFAWALAGKVFYLSGTVSFYESLIFLSECTRFAMAPALYLSVLSFTTPNRRLTIRDLLHFIPLILFDVFLTWTWMFPKTDSGLNPEVAKAFGRAIFFSVKIQAVVYWILSFVSLRRYQKMLGHYASRVDNVTLNWLKYFLIGIISIVFLWIHESFFHIPWLLTLTPFGYLMAVLALGFFALRQEEIFPYKQQDAQVIREIILDDKRKKARLSDTRVEELKAIIVNLMAVKKPFLDPNLSLPELGRLLDVSTHDLSFVLNAGFGESFFQFVNRYRVEEASRLLLSDKHRHLNMIGIAFEAGFNSKTTFNTTFKKLKGQSPSEFAGSHNSTPDENLS
jgi:AraC-like DNA-binding protein